jgi:hypothetical protein
MISNTLDRAAEFTAKAKTQMIEAQFMASRLSVYNEIHEAPIHLELSWAQDYLTQLNVMEGGLMQDFCTLLNDYEEGWHMGPILDTQPMRDSFNKSVSLRNELTRELKSYLRANFFKPDAHRRS